MYVFCRQGEDCTGARRVFRGLVLLWFCFVPIDVAAGVFAKDGSDVVESRVMGTGTW